MKFHIVKCELRRNTNRDTSIELQPLGTAAAATTTTTTTTTTRVTTATTTMTNNGNSHGYLLPDNMPSGPSVQTQPSGIYSYPYDHFFDRIVAFFSLHLRHRQDLYSLSRPSSVPPTQAPYPPGHTPPSSPLIPPSRSQEDPGNRQWSSPGDDVEEVGQTSAHVSTSPELVQRIESSFYDEILDNELTNEYSDVAEVLMD